MKKKEFWKRMAAVGYTKDIFCLEAGVQKQSLYNWREPPKYLVFALEALEKRPVRVSEEEYNELLVASERYRKLKGLWDEFGRIIAGKD